MFEGESVVMSKTPTRITCSRCGGIGTVSNYQCKCVTCFRGTAIDCPECKGIGTVPDLTDGWDESDEKSSVVAYQTKT